MTQFRSKKDGSHYPIGGGKPIYPNQYFDEMHLNYLEKQNDTTIQNLIDGAWASNDMEKYFAYTKYLATRNAKVIDASLESHLPKLDICMNVDAVHDYLNDHYVLEHQWHHEMVGTHKIWEFPPVTENNKTAGIMGTYYSTIYYDDITHEHVFIEGKMGNTSTYVIRGARNSQEKIGSPGQYEDEFFGYDK